MFNISEAMEAIPKLQKMAEEYVQAQKDINAKLDYIYASIEKLETLLRSQFQLIESEDKENA